LCSFISPFAADRALVRGLFGAGEFVEVFIDTPIEDCMARDPKGLYAKALKGEIKNFTGLDSPYEAPENPDIHIKTQHMGAIEAAQSLVDQLEAAGLLTLDAPDWSI
jgi:bifunctional enzyme CysN/CysC